MDFASDNTSGVCGEVLEAIVAANAGADWPYGEDATTARLEAVFARWFDHDVAVFPVLTGTAANSLALSRLCPPYGAVLCHESAHVYVDECGAPELQTGGARLVPLPGADGRLHAATLHAAIASHPGHDVHGMPLAALTLTQATECGTVYAPDALSSCAAVARDAGLRVHLDGARLANALVATGATPAACTWQAGVDVVSFGATKNGCLAAEAVVFFDRSLVGDFAFRRKRAGQLASKMRFVSAQLEAYLRDDVWRRNAMQANEMAARLAAGFAAIEGVVLRFPVEANEVFVALPARAAERLRAAGARFFGEVVGEQFHLRLVASWSTTADEVDALLEATRNALM